MSLHPTATMQVLPLRLADIVRCSQCHAATVDGIHLDTGLPNCRTGSPVRLCPSCRHDEGAHAPSTGCWGRHRSEPDYCRCQVPRERIRGTG